MPRWARPWRTRALDLGGLVVVACREVEPDEVGLRLGRLHAEPAQPVLEPDPLGEVALDAAGDLVLVVERLERGGLRGGVAEERLADLVDGGAEVLRAAEAEADAQPAEAVDLGEGAQQDEVRVPLEQADRLVRVLQDVELGVGLVEDHGDVRRDVGDERLDVLERQRGRGRVVRVADDDEPRGDGDLLAHLVQVVLVVGVQRDLDGGGAGGGREVRVDREARPRVDDLGAGLEQRVAGGEQDVAGAVADRDPVGRHAVAVGEPGAQRGVRRVGVAVDPAQHLRDRLDDLGDRRVRALVGGELRDRALRGVAVGGGIDGDAPDLGAELERHESAEVTSRAWPRTRRAAPPARRRSGRSRAAPRPAR